MIRDDVLKVGRVLAESARTLESADHADDRVQRVLELTRELVPFEECALLRASEGREPDLFVVPAMLAPEDRLRLTQTLLRHLRVLADADAVEAPLPGGPHLALPVMGLDRVIGVLRVEPAAGMLYDARHLGLLSVTAAQLGAYLAMLRLREDEALRAGELAKAHEFQQMLLAIVGHDLRNPLAVITTATEHLARTLQDPRQRKNAERALRNAEKANHIITDVLDVTHVRVSGQLPAFKQRVNLRSLLEELVDDFQSQHLDVTLGYGPNEPQDVDCDPTRISQLTANLVNNALSHGLHGGAVRVTLHVGHADAVVAVHNRGPVIPPAILPVIFDPFRQGAEKKRAAGGGLGLGLYIVDQIARAHGGRVVATSNESDGTTFTVTIARFDARSDTTPQPAITTTMVMVVDDDADVRETVATLLRSNGFVVAQASNGAEALELLRGGLRPSLVLLDLFMPVLDGEGFCDAVRADPALSNIPICITSSDVVWARRLSKTASLAFLPKPLRPADVLQTLKRVTH